VITVLVEKRIPYPHIPDMLDLEMTEGSQLGELLRQMDLEQHIAMVNRQHVDHGYVLQDRDEVLLLPILQGG